MSIAKAFREDRKDVRMVGIDLLRGLCAAAVMMFHLLFLFPYSGAVPWGMTAPHITQYGYLGVEVFFMISGFVISMSAEGKTRRQFLASRLARILPTFWICLGITIFVMACVGRLPPTAQIAANLFVGAVFFGSKYIDGSYWSLTVEILFYSAVFLFVMGDRFRSRIMWFSLFWTFLTLVNFFYKIPIASIHSANWAPYFSIGIFMYLNCTDTRRIYSVGILYSVALSSVHAHFYATKNSLPLINPILTSIIIIISSIIMLMLTKFSISPRFNHLIITIGAISYPLYLVHGTTGSIFIEQLYPLGFPGVAFGVFVILFLSYTIAKLEQPLARKMRDIVGGSRPVVR